MKNSMKTMPQSAPEFRVNDVVSHSDITVNCSAPPRSVPTAHSRFNASSATARATFTPVRAAYRLMLALLIVLVTAPSSVEARKNEFKRGDEICGSPRFLVKSGDDQAFLLKSTNVAATIVGVIAEVRIRQVYYNSGASPVEATYIFPASTRAAVYAMNMKVRDRVINAVIKEKEQARRIYKEAVEAGKVASLLEQLRPNIFQMSVGNILPRDSVVVELKYTEAIDYANGVYEFVYPAVVGPRYVSSATPKEYDDIISSRDLPKEIPGEFHIELHLATGVPLKSVASPTHSIDVNTFNARTNAAADLGDEQSITRVTPTDVSGNGANRDFVVRYRLSGRAIESGLLLSKGEKENFFMLMVQPPKNVDIPLIVPREYVFIVDVSGSMWGQPMDIAKQLMSDLLDKLRPIDKFNILMFSGGNRALAENSLAITPETKQRAKSFLNSGYGGGGTELLPALKRALSMNAEEGCSRSFVAVTDGFVQCEREAFALVRNNLNKANFYAFGIGGNVNRFLIEGLARAGNADPMIVTNMSEAPKMAEQFREYIEAPVMTNIKIDYGKLNVYDVDPLSIPDVTAKRPIIVFGKWNGDASGTLQVSGSTASGAYNFRVDVGAQPMRPEYNALRYLWARNRIRMIQDGSINGWGYATEPTDQEKATITALGLQYNLLTDYTSFVAVDSVVSVRKSGSTASTKTSTKDTVRTKDDGTPKTITRDSIQGGIPTRTYRSMVQHVEVHNNDALTAAPPPTTAARGGVSGSGSALGNGGMSIKGGRPTESKSKTLSAADAQSTVREKSAADVKADEKEDKQSQITSSALNSSGNNTASSTATPSTGAVNSGSGASTTQQTEPAAHAGTGQAVSGSTRSTRSTANSATVERSNTAMDFSNPLSPGVTPSRVYHGPLASVGSVTSLADISSVNPTLLRGDIPSGAATGTGFNVGWSVEYLLSSPGSTPHSIIAELSYNRLSASYDADKLVNVFRAQTFDSAQVDARYSVANTLSYLNLSLLFRHNIAQSRLGIFAGPSIALLLKSHADRSALLDSGFIWFHPTQSTVEPTDQSGRRVILLDGDLPQAARLRLGVTAGLQYEFLFRTWSLVPSLQYHYALTALYPDNRFSSLALGLAVRFGW